MQPQTTALKFIDAHFKKITLCCYRQKHMYTPNGRIKQKCKGEKIHELYGMRLIVSLYSQDRPFTRAQGNLKKQGETSPVPPRPATSMVTEGDVIVFKGKSKIIFRFTVLIAWSKTEILLCSKGKSRSC